LKRFENIKWVLQFVSLLSFLSDINQWRRRESKFIDMMTSFVLLKFMILVMINIFVSHLMWKKIMGQLRLIKWGQDKNFTLCYSKIHKIIFHLKYKVFKRHTYSYIFLVFQVLFPIDKNFIMSFILNLHYSLDISILSYYFKFILFISYNNLIISYILNLYYWLV